MALQKCTWIPRKTKVFDGIADTGEDFALVPHDCAPGSIIYIVSTNIFVVKRPDGSWIGIPESVVLPPNPVDPLPPNYLHTRRWEIMMANQIEKWRENK